MIVIGFDPGLERVGFGVLRKVGSRITCLEYGLIKTPAGPLGPRLKQIHQEVDTLIGKHQPQSIAVEKLFFTKNQTSGMDVAKALGCVLLAVEERGLAAEEYSPPQVKQSVVGNGAADKKQVQFMVTKLLGLKETPKPDDVADALAIAITHLMRCGPANIK